MDCILGSRREVDRAPPSGLPTPPPFVLTQALGDKQTETTAPGVWNERPTSKGSTAVCRHSAAQHQTPSSLIQAPAWPASHRAKSGTSDPPVSRKLRTVTFGHWSWIFKTPFSHVHQYMNFTVSPSPQGFPLNPLPPQVYQTVFLVARNK